MFTKRVNQLKNKWIKLSVKLMLLLVLVVGIVIHAKFKLHDSINLNHLSLIMQLMFGYNIIPSNFV